MGDSDVCVTQVHADTISREGGAVRFHRLSNAMVITFVSVKHKIRTQLFCLYLMGICIIFSQHLSSFMYFYLPNAELAHLPR